MSENNKGLSVTSEDLEAFRRLLKFFFVESLKNIMAKEPEKVTMVKKVLGDLDSHFWLEEPFISAQIGMAQADAATVTLVVAPNIFEAYKNFAFYDIKSNYLSIVPDASEEKAIVDTAIRIQKRLAEVLDNAVDIHPEPDVSFGQSPNKMYLN